MSKAILDQIYENKIIAIIRGIGSDRIVDTVAALVEGGIKLVEVTFNHDSETMAADTLRCLELLKKVYGDRICMGAGTVLTPNQVMAAVDAGAEYVISPNTDTAVIEKTKQLGKISIPGCFTPSEIVTAYNAGADVVKLFPAGILGIEYIKAVLAPLSHIPMVAVGGVNVDNVLRFIAAGVKGVGVGGSLVDKNTIYAGKYDIIEQVARDYVSRLKG